MSQAAFDMARTSKRGPSGRGLVEPTRGAGMLMIVAFRDGDTPMAFRMDQLEAEAMARHILEIGNERSEGNL